MLNYCKAFNIMTHNCASLFMEGSYLHVEEERLEDWTDGLILRALAVYVRGRVRNKQFCMNIGGGLVLKCKGKVVL